MGGKAAFQASSTEQPLPGLHVQSCVWQSKRRACGCMWMWQLPRSVCARPWHTCVDGPTCECLKLRKGEMPRSQAETEIRCPLNNRDCDVVALQLPRHEQTHHA